MTVRILPNPRVNRVGDVVLIDAKFVEPSFYPDCDNELSISVTPDHQTKEDPMVLVAAELKRRGF